ncbi:hypothetical protein C0J52_06532 [Blattella germanica]|nr:hypothetical protein C0J52_06532 [Blattella germanica]
MLKHFLYPMVYLLMCAPVIHSERHTHHIENTKDHRCPDCAVPLNPKDNILQKYAQTVLEAVQIKIKQKLKVVNIEDASYIFSDGLQYEFTIYLTGILQKIDQKCRAKVLQGYRSDDITIIDLQCNEINKASECENCAERLDPKNPFLQKYLMLVLEKLKNRTNTDFRLLAVEDTSFQVSNGVIFKFTLHLVDTREELSIETCNVIVYQGAKIEEVNITEIKCETEKIPECVNCEVFLDSEDPILQKYVNITIQKLIKNGTYLLHLLGVKNASYRVS